VLMVFCVSEGAQQRAEQSRYHCIRAAAASERCVLPLDEVADVSVSHHGPASCQHPLAVVGRSGLAVDGWQHNKGASLSSMAGGWWWKIVAVAGRVRSKTRDG
jgi:hypothetical protein